MSLLKTLLAAGIIAASPSYALAKTPPEVLSAYKQYLAALKADDIKTIRSTAKAAWQLAEESVGDSKLTGDLAFNYATYIDGKVEKDQIDAIDRSMALVQGYGEDAGSVYLERGIRKLTILSMIDKSSRRLNVAKNLLDFAEENGMGDSTFAAELMTVMAGEYAGKGWNRRSAEMSERALMIFDTAKDGIPSAYPIQANLYRGYALEAEEDHMGAALSYQSVMEATDGLDPAEYPLVGTALGRWIYMRGSLQVSGSLEEAEQNGLCQCWPYDKARNEDVVPIKRVPPMMPRNALQSGYVVVEFDLTDEGKPTAERVITAWPEYFEKPALKALEDWEYSPRTHEQTDNDRKDIVTTIRFQLTDQSGKVIW